MKNRTVLEWDSCINLICNLIDDADYTMAMFILVAINTGFKVGKIRKLRWANVLSKHEIMLEGISLQLNEDFFNIANYIYRCSNEPPKISYIFLSNKKVPYSVQRINVLLKEINKHYKLGVKDLTTHSLRKVFGRKIVEQSNNRTAALLTLTKYFNHVRPSITIDYLDLKDFEMKCYGEIGINNTGRFCYLVEKEQIEKVKKTCGFVYLMKDLSYPNITKIGKSKNPSCREATLAHQIPTIQLFKVVKTENMNELETILHKQYSHKRKRGEWFELSKKDIDEICEAYDFIDYVLD